MSTTSLTCELTIDGVDLIFDYNYRATEITDHKCRICSKHLMEPIYDKKLNSIDTRVSLGKCGHSFHTKCIEILSNVNKKIDQPVTDLLCPIDQTTWIQKRILDNKNTFSKLILSDVNYIENPTIHFKTPQVKK